jgi:serine/threonine protein kinase
MAGDTDFGQLEIIFRALGTPTEQEWPGYTKLEGYVAFEKVPKPDLGMLFGAASKDAIDLLSKLLTFDPRKRITARQVRFRLLPLLLALTDNSARTVGTQTSILFFFTIANTPISPSEADDRATTSRPSAARRGSNYEEKKERARGRRREREREEGCA